MYISANLLADASSWSNQSKSVPEKRCTPTTDEHNRRRNMEKTIDTPSLNCKCTADNACGGGSDGERMSTIHDDPVASTLDTCTTRQAGWLFTELGNRASVCALEEAFNDRVVSQSPFSRCRLLCYGLVLNRLHFNCLVLTRMTWTLMTRCSLLPTLFLLFYDSQKGKEKGVEIWQSWRTHTFKVKGLCHTCP